MRAASVTHGLTWAPETHPKHCMHIKTAKPMVKKMRRLSSWAVVSHFMSIEQLKNTSIAVPNSSAKKIETFSKWRTPRFVDAMLQIYMRLKLFWHNTHDFGTMRIISRQKLYWWLCENFETIFAVQSCILKWLTIAVGMKDKLRQPKQKSLETQKTHLLLHTC